LGALDEARAEEVFGILSKVRREGTEPATSTARSTRSTGA
jgi:hypothetical protein